MSDSKYAASGQRPLEAGAAPLSITTSRIAELDGLRGIAVLMVMLLHTRPTMFFWGWAGVDLFLVLSGFLITRILLENRGQPGMMRAFYVRRALRIWPVYYVTWFATAAIFVLTAEAGVPAAEGMPPGHWRGLLFLQNIEHYFPDSALSSDYIWYFEHSWSVAVEEQFYLVWPVILLFAADRRTGLLILGASVLAAAYIARAQSMSLHVLLTRVDGLVLGAAIAYASILSPRLLETIRLRALVYVALAGAALVAPYLLLGFADPRAAFGARAAPVLGFSILFAVALALSLRSAGHEHLRWLRWSPLRWVGQISFGLYMYHVPIGFLGLLGVNQGLWDRPVAKVIMWGGSLALAHLSFRWMERPILSLKSATPYRAPAPAPATESTSAGSLQPGTARPQSPSGVNP